MNIWNRYVWTVQHTIGGAASKAADEDNEMRKQYYDEKIKGAADDYLNKYRGRDDEESKTAFADYSKKVDDIVTQRDAYNRALMGVDTYCELRCLGFKPFSFSGKTTGGVRSLEIVV